MPLKYADIGPSDAAVIFGGVDYDRWIIGTGADSDEEYVIHLSWPAFVAKFSDARGVEVRPGGLSVEVEGTKFFDILWLGGTPSLSDDEMLALFRAANDAITRYSFGGEEEE